MSIKNMTHYVLSEAARSELSSAENIREDAVESKFKSVYTEIDELSEDLVYSEETIPIFAVDGVPVVEHDMLAKFMESNDIVEVEEAIDRLKEHYNLDSLTVVVESQDEASIAMAEAKMFNRPLALKKGLIQMEAQMTLFDKLKKKGIPMLKKKPKLFKKKKSKK